MGSYPYASISSLSSNVSSKAILHPIGFRSVEDCSDMLPNAEIRQRQSKAMLQQMEALARKQPRSWKFIREPPMVASELKTGLQSTESAARLGHSMLLRPTKLPQQEPSQSGTASKSQPMDSTSSDLPQFGRRSKPQDDMLQRGRNRQDLLIPQPLIGNSEKCSARNRPPPLLIRLRSMGCLGTYRRKHCTCCTPSQMSLGKIQLEALKTPTRFNPPFRRFEPTRAWNSRRESTRRRCR